MVKNTNGIREAGLSMLFCSRLPVYRSTTRRRKQRRIKAEYRKARQGHEYDRETYGLKEHLRRLQRQQAE